MNPVFELMATLGLDDSKFKAGLSDAEGQASGFGSKIGGALGKVGGIVAGGLAAGTAAVAAFAKSSVDTGMAFDTSMSQVAATMGKTMAEMESEVGSVDLAWGTFSGNLREYAQEMGANTAFSASQAADALNYMALAGYDTQTSMEMLPNVLNLAAAGSMDLATASDMVTDAQSALGLEFPEVVTMVDQMAKASSTTNTSVEQLGDAILTIGATARSVKGGTAELSTVLGILADNGIKGSEGGTHLRNAILSLQTPTKDGIEALSQLGLTYDDMYDSAGNLRSLPEIFQELSSKMEGMTQQSKDAIISGIFNKTDLAAINALVGTTGDRWEEVAAKIGDATGAAEAMANTQLDNLAGDITLFQSALEGAQIVVSDGMMPAIREFVQFATDGITDVTNAFRENGIGGAMEALGGFLGDAIAKINEFIPTMIETGGQLLVALVEGISQNVSIIAESSNAVIMTFVEAIIQVAPQLLEASAQMIAELSNGIGQSLPKLVPMAVEAVLTFAQNLIENLPMMIDASLQLIVGLAEGIINALPVLIEKAPEIIEALVNALLDSIPKIAEAGARLIESLVTNLPEILVKLAAAALQIVDELITGILVGVPKLIIAGVQLLEGLVEGIKNAISKPVEAIKEVGQKVWEAIKDFFKISSPSKLFAEIGENLIAGLTEGVKEKWDSFKNAVMDFVKGVPDIFKDLPGKLKDAGQNAIEFLGNGASAAWNTVKNGVSGIAKGIGDAFSGVPETMKNVGRGVASGISGGLGEGSGDLSNAFNTIGGTIRSWIDNMNGVKDSMMTIGSNIMAGLSNGITSKAREAAQAAVNAAKNVVNSVKASLGIASPSKVFAEIGEFMMKGLGKGVGDVADNTAAEIYDTMSKIGETASESAIKPLRNAFNEAGIFGEIDSLAPSMAESAIRDVATDASIGPFSVQRYGNTNDGGKILNIVLEIDHQQLGRAVYRLNNEENQRVGMRLAGGMA